MNIDQASGEPIIRLAAKGDGVTASGRHVSGGVPGDSVDADGTLIPGPHHQTPPCRHFAACGGCQLQHADDTVLGDFVRDRALNAAVGQGLDPEELLPVHLSPPHSRRRAGLHGLRVAGGAAPLPWIPVVNPLELAQLAVLVLLLRWWVPEDRSLPPAKIVLLSSMAFVWVTAVVLHAVIAQDQVERFAGQQRLNT